MDDVGVEPTTSRTHFTYFVNAKRARYHCAKRPCSCFFLNVDEAVLLFVDSHRIQLDHSDNPLKSICSFAERGLNYATHWVNPKLSFALRIATTSSLILSNVPFLLKSALYHDILL